MCRWAWASIKCGRRVSTSSDKPRTLAHQFCGLGTMGFGLPCGDGRADSSPDALVVDIDGDGSFQMNIQELAHLLLRKPAGENSAAQ